MEIHDLRVAGQRPAEFVVCSTVGDLPFRWLTHVDLHSEWDLLWAIDLDVVVVARSDDNVGQLLMQFRRHRPRTLVLWLDDAAGGYDVKFFPRHETITRPVDQWIWEIDMFPMRAWENLAMLDLMTGELA
jgi:hypothetical protein